MPALEHMEVAMRPFKHVARVSDGGAPRRYQNIIGIDLATFHASWGDVPIVATTEAERITLYYWDDILRQWMFFEREHEPLTFDGETPDAPNAWNWSDRVAVACSDTTVFVVYKRYPSNTEPFRATVILDRYETDAGTPTSPTHRLRFRNSIDVFPVTTEVGRSLWAEYNTASSELLILCQVHSRATRFDPVATWKLCLVKCRVNSAGGVSLTSADVTDGGFDLDARLAGARLIAVHRRTAEAFRVPMIRLAGAGLHLTSGTDADPFYEPLLLTTIDIATAHGTTEALPGGEHPQVHRTDPLLVTMDRPARLDLALDTPIRPLPPRRPRVIWEEGRTDKVAWLRDGAETFRGALLTGDARTIPRSHASMDAATHLFENRGGLLLHASPFRYSPVHVLALARDRKGLTLDLLHHREMIGLFRTRLQASLSSGVLGVSNRAFEVWDIGHGQIGDPDALTPSADGETSQFAPTGGLSVTRSLLVNVRAVLADNTIGGHLAADTSTDRVGFFAYSDLGDGCLRVIFAPDIPALSDPPPIVSEKALRPEQVTGPHLRCDEWIELQAAEFVDSGLIGYPVGLLFANRSLGSTFEVPIDFLLDACAIITGDGSGPGGAPLNPFNGLTRPQLVAVDEHRAALSAPRAITMAASDGSEIPVTVTPGALIAGVGLACSAGVGGTTPVGWTMTPLDLLSFVPPGPIAPGAAFPAADQIVVQGNPATITVPRAGRWRLSVFLPDPAGGPPIGASDDVTILPSTFEMVTALYNGVAEGDLYKIGDLHLTALQYAVDYVTDDAGEVTSIKILTRPKRGTELRFSGGGLGQGLVESEAVFSFSTEKMKFKFGLDLLFHVKRFALTLRYGRPFTPGMLMSDRRSRAVLDGKTPSDRGCLRDRGADEPQASRGNRVETGRQHKYPEAQGRGRYRDLAGRGGSLGAGGRAPGPRSGEHRSDDPRVGRRRHRCRRARSNRSLRRGGRCRCAGGVHRGRRPAGDRIHGEGADRAAVRIRRNPQPTRRAASCPLRRRRSRRSRGEEDPRRRPRPWP